MFGVKLERYIIVQALIAGCLNIGELIVGFGVGWSAPIIPKLQDPEQTPLPYLISDYQLSWVASSIYFGIVGAFMGSFTANKIGRKKTLIVGGVLNILAYTLLTAARNIITVYIGRFFVGCVMGLLAVVGIIYIGEIASPNIRGIILTSMGVFHAIGGLLVYSVGPFVSYAAVGYLVMAIDVLFIFLCCFLPESPMYYVIKDDESSARSALKYLGRDTDTDVELKAMMKKFHEQPQQKQIWRELFTVSSNKKSLFITIGLAFFQHASGIMAVIFFATTIFQDAGSSVRPDVATIIVGATFTVGAFMAPVFIERCGRRTLLAISTAGCGVSMTVIGVYFYLKIVGHPQIQNLGWLPLTSLVAAIFMYSVGLSIIPNSLSGELFTPKARGLGTSIMLSCGWISGLISTTVFSYIVVALGPHVTFWIFAAVNALAFVFALTLVPETRMKSLMEIQIMMDNEGTLKK